MNGKPMKDNALPFNRNHLLSLWSEKWDWSVVYAFFGTQKFDLWSTSFRHETDIFFKSLKTNNLILLNHFHSNHIPTVKKAK